MQQRSRVAAASMAACAALWTGTSAWAQPGATDPKGSSSVTVYGALDMGLEYVNNVATSSGIHDMLRMSAGSLTSSVFGLRGTEDLGRGTKAIWNLEGGFSLDTGNSSHGGRLFGRQAYVGLAGRYGQLTLGRQFTMRFFGTAAINPFLVGSHGLPTLDEGFSNPRADNSISYRINMGGLETGVNYSFGRDGTNSNSVVGTNCPGETSSSKQCREWSALLKYTAGAWGLVSSYERQYGGTAATFGGLTSPDLTDSRLTLGGYVLVGGNKITAGWIKRNNEGSATPKSNLVWLMGSIPVTPAFTIDAMVAQLRFEDSPNKATAVALRALYALSKRTAIYVTADHVNNSGTLSQAATAAAARVSPPQGGSQLSVISGIRHKF